MKSEANDTEKDGQNSKATQLYGLTTNGINSSHRNPISGYQSGNGKNEIAHTVVIQPVQDKIDEARRLTFGKPYFHQRTQ